MSPSESFAALRRANPRTRPGFAQSFESTAHAIRAEIAATGVTGSMGRARPATPRRRVAGVSAAGAVAIAAAAAVAVFLTVGSPGGSPSVESAAAAVKQAVSLTAAAAEASGTVVVRITHNGELWASTTIRWNGDDLSVSRGEPRRPGKAGSELLVVDGTVYAIEPDVGWVAQGTPENIDPGSGTTPGEYLAAVREDVGGATLRRITDGMTGLTTIQLDDGSIVYSGTVPAGLIARETGFKEGESLRVFPFGFVAHDEAANAAAPLDTAVAVGAEGIVREIALTWGTWTYTVRYSKLGASPALVAPVNAPSLEELRQASLRASGK
jgi:hypothetical protein